MEYFNTIAIGHYKGIKELNISSFAKINLITGPNGCGKTALIEALEILSKPTDFSHYVAVTGNSFAGFVSSFDKREARPYTAISGDILCSRYSMEITSYYPIENNVFQGYFTYQYPLNNTPKTIRKEITYSITESPLLQKATSLLNIRKVTPKDAGICLRTIHQDTRIKEKVLAILSLFDDEIEDFHTDDFSEYFIYHKQYKNLTPEFFSDGICFLLKIAEQLAGFHHGVFLVDGLDYAFSKQTIPEVVNFLYQLAKEREIQLFLTTQSAELIDEWLDLMNDYNDLEHLKIIRLKSDKQQTTCKEYHGNRAFHLRMESDADFRDEIIR